MEAESFGGIRYQQCVGCRPTKMFGRVVLGGVVSIVSDSLGGSAAMRSKRVCDVMFVEVSTLWGKSILLSRSINVWVISNCFRSNSIMVWGGSIACRFGRFGERIGWIFRVGVICVVVSDGGVSEWNLCWGYKGIVGRGLHFPCFGGVSI